MKKAIIFFCLMLVFLFENPVQAQETKYQEQVRTYLDNIRGNDGNGFQPSIYIIHLFTDEDFSVDKRGIYKFGVSGSHQKVYILLFDGKTLKFLEENLLPEKVLEQCFLFFKKEETYLSEYDKTIYLENILKVVQENIRPLGSWLEDHEP